MKVADSSPGESPRPAHLAAFPLRPQAAGGTRALSGVGSRGPCYLPAHVHLTPRRGEGGAASAQWAAPRGAGWVPAAAAGEHHLQAGRLFS